MVASGFPFPFWRVKGSLQSFWFPSKAVAQRGSQASPACMLGKEEWVGWNMFLTVPSRKERLRITWVDGPGCLLYIWWQSPEGHLQGHQTVLVENATEITRSQMSFLASYQLEGNAWKPDRGSQWEEGLEIVSFWSCFLPFLSFLQKRNVLLL